MHANFINGQFVAPSGAERIAVLNPARGTVIAEVPDTPSARAGRRRTSADECAR